jgi:hypothetical protein
MRPHAHWLHLMLFAGFATRFWAILAICPKLEGLSQLKNKDFDFFLARLANLRYFCRRKQKTTNNNNKKTKSNYEKDSDFEPRGSHVHDR